jgi:hypothetical protein
MAFKPECAVFEQLIIHKICLHNKKVEQTKDSNHL